MRGTPRRLRVVVVGSSFAGLTAAQELRRRLGDQPEIVVVDRNDHFSFIPSLIWVPFGGREPSEITFPLAPVYQERGITFIHDTAESIDTDWHHVVLSRHGHLDFDRLLVATGPGLDFDRVQGLGPETGYTESICTLEHAGRARSSWRRLEEAPGPVVVGAAQGTSYFAPAYEYALNAARDLQSSGIGAPVTFVTAEPYLGHFGFGGAGRSRAMATELLERLDVEALPNEAIVEVRDGEMELASGRVLPFAHAMVIPPLRGVDMVRASFGLGDDAGWIPVDGEYRHPRYRDVFAAGANVAVSPRTSAGAPIGGPRSGYMSERMARVAARNIAADLGSGSHEQLPAAELGAVSIVDAGDTGLVVRRESGLGAGMGTHAIEGPQSHWAKVAFEKYFLSTRKRGFVRR